jgi:hypothetical protein
LLIQHVDLVIFLREREPAYPGLRFNKTRRKISPGCISRSGAAVASNTICNGHEFPGDSSNYTGIFALSTHLNSLSSHRVGRSANLPSPPLWNSIHQPSRGNRTGCRSRRVRRGWLRLLRRRCKTHLDRRTNRHLSP